MFTFWSGKLYGVSKNHRLKSSHGVKVSNATKKDVKEHRMNKLRHKTKAGENDLSDF